MCHTTSLLLSGIGFIFLPSKEAHFCPFYKDFPSFVYEISHTPCLLSSSRCASRGKRGDHLPGFLVMASDAGEEGECFSKLVHLQREGLGACETGFPTPQGRGRKLVTEDWKPVGSGRFRVPSQDSSWVLGPTWSLSFPLRQGPHLGSSSQARISPHSRVKQPHPLYQAPTLSASQN